MMHCLVSSLYTVTRLCVFVVAYAAVEDGADYCLFASATM